MKPGRPRQFLLEVALPGFWWPGPAIITLRTLLIGPAGAFARSRRLAKLTWPRASRIFTLGTEIVAFAARWELPIEVATRWAEVGWTTLRSPESQIVAKLRPPLAIARGTLHSAALVRTRAKSERPARRTFATILPLLPWSPRIPTTEVRPRPALGKTIVSGALAASLRVFARRRAFRPLTADLTIARRGRRSIAADSVPLAVRFARSIGLRSTLTFTIARATRAGAASAVTLTVQVTAGSRRAPGFTAKPFPAWTVSARFSTRSLIIRIWAVATPRLRRTAFTAARPALPITLGTHFFGRNPSVAIAIQLAEDFACLREFFAIDCSVVVRIECGKDARSPMFAATIGSALAARFARPLWRARRWVGWLLLSKEWAGRKRDRHGSVN